MTVTRLGATLVTLTLAAVLHGAPAELATAGLSSETRMLLIREMQALSESMARIHAALVIGNHAAVTAEAHNIHDSFVLAQNLSEDQRQELATKLPQGFLALDERLHAMAAELAVAGEAGDPNVARFWFDEMTRACQDCHRDFAAGRFPGLASDGHGTGSHRE